jgi:hypothetical protein
VEDDLPPAKVAGLVEELAQLRASTTQWRAENARLLQMLELTPKQAPPPGPVQTGFFEAHPGPIDRRSAPEVKVDFFAALFAARTDVYATRWENARTGKVGWLPAVRGGWRKDIHCLRQEIPEADDLKCA